MRVNKRSSSFLKFSLKFLYCIYKNLNTKNMNKFYLDKSNAWVAGVCSGISNWLNIDVTLVRILMLLFVLGAGCGIWIYLLIWLFAPSR